MRNCLLAVVLGLFLAGCGGESVRLGTADPEPPPEPSAGWSIRDDAPYPRSAHSAVLDEANDRMIVFGGAANDVWALPLSGPDANVWSQVLARGEQPPAHAYAQFYRDSAVHDPLGNRMLVLLNQNPAVSSQEAKVDLWQLSLEGTAVWKRVVISGASPGAELQNGRLAIDVKGRRLFALGGSYEHSGLWFLSLGQGPAPSWTRIADVPQEAYGFYGDTSLIFDAARKRLVLFGGHSATGLIWALSLRSSSWEVLDREGYNGSDDEEVVGVLDPDGERVVFGGTRYSGVAWYSLSTDEWHYADAPSPYGQFRGASGVLDRARRRILYFGGGTPYLDQPRPSNVVWTLELDSLSWSEVVPGSRNAAYPMAGRTLVWDPARAAVVAYGSLTDLHGLNASDGWTTLTDVLFSTPPVSDAAGIYDPVASAIVTFGGDNGKDRLARLVWAPGPIWETLDAGPGPIGRSSHVAVYDSAEHRLIVHGGRSIYQLPIDDAWALSLDGRPRWTPLVPSGTSPGPRVNHVGIYDPRDHRLIIYTDAQNFHSLDESIKRQGSWSLSLGNAPEWTELAATGPTPGKLDAEAAAVYDAAGHRMIVVNFAKSGAARVYALELDTLAWHEFCWSTITPARTEGTGNAVLAPDGIFLTTSSGAFRFDLETPYCK